MKTLLIVSVALCAFACGKEGGAGPVQPNPVEPTPDGKTKVTFTFATSALKKPASVSRADVDENAIDNLWVLQFATTKTDAKLLVSEYFTATDITTDKDGNKSVSVALEDAAEPKTYCVVNVGEETLKGLTVEKTELADFEKMLLSMQEETAAQIPMIGFSTEATSVGTTTVQLMRMIAKIGFTCIVEVPAGHKFTPTRVQLCNVANVAAYVAPTVPTAAANLYPEASSDNFFNYKEDADVATTTDASKFSGKPFFVKTWYLPENLRGVVAGLTAEQKGKENAPEFATCIEISGDYEIGEKITDVTYRVYPGANATNDFNIVRNHTYSISVRIQGLNPNDIRVDIEKGVEAGQYTDDETWE